MAAPVGHDFSVLLDARLNSPTLFAVLRLINQESAGQPVVDGLSDVMGDVDRLIVATLETASWIWVTGDDAPFQVLREALLDFLRSMEVGSMDEVVRRILRDEALRAEAVVLLRRAVPSAPAEAFLAAAEAAFLAVVTSRVDARLDASIEFARRTVQLRQETERPSLLKLEYDLHLAAINHSSTGNAGADMRAALASLVDQAASREGWGREIWTPKAMLWIWREHFVRSVARDHPPL